jgi:glycine cleavage system aminomethyltransferase T
MSPSAGRPVALGYVHRDFVEPGTAVAIAAGDASVPATVVELPFVR